MTKAEILCVIVPVFMMKTSYVWHTRGLVFYKKIKEDGIFVLCIINGIIMPKTNKF